MILALMSTTLGIVHCQNCAWPSSLNADYHRDVFRYARAEAYVGHMARFERMREVEGIPRRRYTEGVIILRR